MSDSGIRRHTVHSFDEELDRLTRLILEMGGMVEGQLQHAIRALVEGNEAAADEVIARDDAVDELEETIDREAIRILATRQPLAIDLRMVAMALKISNDLERMSDYAVNIAKRTKKISDQVRFKPMITIPRMGQICQEMVKQVLDAYAARDPDQAYAAWKRDEEVDQLYVSLFRELLTYIIEDPRKTSACIELMFIAKNLERIGDHATNIAEKIHYIVHGDRINRMVLPDS